MFDSYFIIIGGSVLIILSYVYDLLSKKLRVPSVIFLIFTGIIIKIIGNYYDFDITEEFKSMLELLGIIGLIMIVLEAAVDLKISPFKFPLIRQSILIAFIVLVLSSLSIALAIMLIRNESFFNSFVYAIPLSVVSSAVLIPSVHSLSQRKKEFMIYEATFSDIIGIMFFNFVVMHTGSLFSLSRVWEIIITLLVSVLASYLMVYLFSKMKNQIKLFLIIAILTIFYSIGKKLHLSTLLIIFIFGLVLNNAKFFFVGRLGEFINFKNLRVITKDFKVVTAETAFLVRTFFFVAFGMFIDLRELWDINVVIVGSVIVVIMYLVRYINFKIFLKADVFPEIFLSPRGLITILLFFSIPAQYQIADFSTGILSFVILSTGIIMMIALIAAPSIKPEELTIVDIGLAPADDLKGSSFESGVFNSVINPDDVESRRNAILGEYSDVHEINPKEDSKKE